LSVVAVVFDLDGTLACLPIDWEALFEEFRRIMHVDVVRPVVDVVSRVDKRTRREVFAAWDRAELAIYQNATPCGEGMQLYRESTGKPMALVTLQGRAVVARLLEKFGLKFEVMVTREDSLFRAEQLRSVIGKLGVPAKDLLFVGNAESDAAAAETLGCQFRRV
jgi:HAD superfamily hydrolase (TIGR01549 family)